MEILIATLMQMQINLYRLENGIPPAPDSMETCEVAQGRLGESTKDFTHNKLQNFNLKQGIWSENLGRMTDGTYGAYENSQRIFKEWRASPSHNANLLTDLDSFCVATDGTNFTFIGYLEM